VSKAEVKIGQSTTESDFIFWHLFWWCNIVGLFNLSRQRLQSHTDGEEVPAFEQVNRLKGLLVNYTELASDSLGELVNVLHAVEVGYRLHDLLYSSRLNCIDQSKASVLNRERVNFYEAPPA